jgi:hypothetical protein
MRNRFNGSRRGRRPDSFGSVPGDNSPYDFSLRDEDSVDPVDLLSIRADDELLDALASGLTSFTGSEGRHALGVAPGLDDNINDDQQMLALLAAWRDEVRDEPIPELISVEDASEVIVAGYRIERPRRRLMSVAAAAAVVVIGLSGVALGAGSAKPGDALWGVSKALNGNRATSLEAAQQVTVTLASVRQALADGRVAEAQAKLASIAPELNKVTDQQTKQHLADTQANLVQTVGQAKEGEKVKTDDSGKRDDDHDSDHHGGWNGHDPRSDESKSDQSNPDQSKSDELKSEVLRPIDPRFGPGKPDGPKPDGSTGPGTAGGGPDSHGPWTGTATSPPDPRKAIVPTTPTTEPKWPSKPSSGPRPSKWNPPPRKTTTNGSNNDGNSHQNQNQNNKPDGEHKAEGEGNPDQTGQQGNGQQGNGQQGNGPQAQQNPPAQPGPRPVPPGS